MGASMIRLPVFGKAARRVGAVVIALIALDLIATTATLALGLEIFKR
jgi:hypothetical protein